MEDEMNLMIDMREVRYRTKGGVWKEGILMTKGVKNIFGSPFKEKEICIMINICNVGCANTCNVAQVAAWE